MTRVYIIKKGYNRISVINLSKALKHQAHAQGVPVKKYEKRGGSPYKKSVAKRW